MSSMKRSIASTVIVVLLVLSLQAAAADAVRVIPDAPGGAIRLPSDGKGVTAAAAAADDKKQLRWCDHPVCVPATDYCFCPYDKKQLWWCEHPVCFPGSDICLCPYTRDRTTTTESGAKNELVHDSSSAAAPPCEHPFCIFIRGEPVCRCLDRTPSTSSVEMRMMHGAMERASSVH